MSARIKLGVSSCLLGHAVRFDAGHKRDRFIAERLAAHFDLVPVCPEAGAGLGVPREAIHWVEGAAGASLVGVRSGRDVTDVLHAFAGDTLPKLSGLSGYVLKKGSPSCGMARVKVYSDQGMPRADGVGLFAARLMEAYPLLPVEEEGRLNDPLLRESFIERVYVYHRWQELMRCGLSRGALVGFHTAHKYLLRARSDEAYRELGRLVANLHQDELGNLAGRYIRVLMTALKGTSTRKRHANVLMHLAGHVKRSLSSDDKAEMLGLIHAYRQGRLPLVVPMTLLKHHLRRNPDAYALSQHYLQPCPDDLSPRTVI